MLLLPKLLLAFLTNVRRVARGRRLDLQEEDEFCARECLPYNLGVCYLASSMHLKRRWEQRNRNFFSFFFFFVWISSFRFTWSFVERGKRKGKERKRRRRGEYEALVRWKQGSERRRVCARVFCAFLIGLGGLIASSAVRGVSIGICGGIFFLFSSFFWY